MEKIFICFRVQLYSKSKILNTKEIIVLTVVGLSIH